MHVDGVHLPLSLGFCGAVRRDSRRPNELSKRSPDRHLSLELSHRVYLSCHIKKWQHHHRSELINHVVALFTVVSCLVVVQWQRWVVFWNPLVMLNRLGVYSSSLEHFLRKVSAKKWATKRPTASKSSRHPEFSQFHSQNQNLTIIQHDYQSNRLFNLYRMVVLVSTQAGLSSTGINAASVSSQIFEHLEQ